MAIQQFVEKVCLNFKEQVHDVLYPGRLLTKLAVLSVLVLALLISAFSVIYASHKHRLAFDQYQTAVRAKGALDTEWRQLLLEQNTWGASGRVERLAREKIGMQVPEYKTIEFVKDEHR